MFIMYDAVTLGNIPHSPHAVGCYANGRYANETEARERFPHAYILPISVEGIVACAAYDIEQGDYTPSDVPELYKVATEAGVWRPCFYAQLSGTMAAVRSELSHVIKARSDVRLWVAYYNGQPDLPSLYDAHQFHTNGYDESICDSSFFRSEDVKPVSPPKPAEVPTKRAIVTYDPKADGWSVEPTTAGVGRS
jgi:hypothetical protein